MTAMDRVAVFMLGLIIGSFLNVVIYRLPRGESIVRPGSRCTDCGAPLCALELVPVLSYVFLRRRCRHCGAVISWRYPAVELVTAALFVVAHMRLGIGRELVFGLVLSAAVVAVSAIDLEHRRIPNVIVIPLAAVGLVSAAATGRVPVHESVIGMVLGALLLGVVAVVSKGGMGMGDAKLLGMIGAWTGWRGMIIALFLGSASTSIVGLLLMAVGVIRRRQPIPFGPFLSLAGYVVYLYEAQLLDMWLG